MSTRSVSIDLKFILDPYKMLFLIAGLGEAHDEIFIPDTLQCIEFWSKNIQPIPIDVFQDDFILDGTLDKFFGYSPTDITSDNFCLGLKVLRRAYDKGMINLLSMNDSAFQKEGMSILGTKKIFLDMYDHVLPGGKQITINPDMGGVTLEALLGVEAKKDIHPIFGDVEFLDHVKEIIPKQQLEGSIGELHIDKGLSLILQSPKMNSFEELWWYAENKKMFSSMNKKLTDAQLKKTTGRDIGILSFKFAGTLVADLALFGGLPISSGLLCTYEIVERIFRHQ